MGRYLAALFFLLPFHMRLLATARLLTSGLALLTPAAQAQTTLSVGPRLGLNAATYHFAESQTGTVGYRAGFEAGLAVSVGLGHVALQPALLYSQKGHPFQSEVEISITNGPIISGPITKSETERRSRLNYMTLPLNVVYQQHADGQGFQVFAGPYVSLLLSGTYDLTTTANGSVVGSQSGRITPVANDAPDFGYFARRFDAGLQGGVGYRYQALLLELGYSLGLRNVAPRYTYNGVPVSSSAYYNRAFQASLSYLFAVSK